MSDGLERELHGHPDGDVSIDADAATVAVGPGEPGELAVPFSPRRPVASTSREGLDSLLSIAKMPRGIAVATLAVGEAGAANAGHLAAQILALSDATLASRVKAFRQRQTAKVLKDRP